jgi:hypothetical protein
MNNFISLTDSELEPLCREEVRMTTAHIDDSACYELFRRALKEGSSETFSLIYLLYKGRVDHWIRSYHAFEATHEVVDYFTNQAFTFLYKELKGDKFDNFPTMGHILAFMRICTERYIGRVAQARIQQPLVSIDDVEISGDLLPPVDDHLHFTQIDQRIRTLLPDAHDYAVFAYRYFYDLPPRDIAELDPVLGSKEHIHVRLRNILRKLRRDPILRTLLNFKDID